MTHPTRPFAPLLRRARLERRFSRATPLVMAGSFIGSSLYFSWIPDPHLTHLGWLPGLIGNWADEYYNLRTAVPFFAIMFWVYAYLRLTPTHARRQKILPPLAFLLPVFAEYGQMFLPERSADWRDVLWGWLGLAAGYASARVCRALLRRLRHRARPYPYADVVALHGVRAAGDDKDALARAA